MSKYAFFRSNASLVIIGSLLGLIGGFKIANLQYRSEQSGAKNREIDKFTKGMSGSQADVNKIIEKARANPNDFEAQVAAASQFIEIESPEQAMPFLEQARRLKPDDPRVSVGLGVANFMFAKYDQAKYDQAMEWLKRSRDQGVDDTTVTALLIGSYIRTRKNLDEADRLIKELEAAGVDAEKLAGIREELKAARSGKTENPGATPQPQTMLKHGPDEPKSGK
jgi:tetratricopeptide (TPR) repeat protein